MFCVLFIILLFLFNCQLKYNLYDEEINNFNNYTDYLLNNKYYIEYNSSKINKEKIYLTYNKIYNLIYELKNLNIIKFYTFYINLNKKTIIFGEQYEQNNFIKSNKNLKINVDDIYYNNIKDAESYVFEKFIDFDFNLKGIYASKKFSDYIEKFFSKNIENKICEKIYQNNIFLYVCDEKNFIINNFPTIYFNVKSLNYNFFLDKNDLFIKYENKIYCLIFFQSSSSSLWTLGEPFIKKYNLLVDFDRKTITFDINEKNNEKKNNIKNNIFYFIFISLLIFIIIFLIVLIFKFYNNKYKKLKGLELEYYPIGN